jgi:uncharacterized protein affecting Mg2+/Co2+ transport
MFLKYVLKFWYKLILFGACAENLSKDNMLTHSITDNVCSRYHWSQQTTHWHITDHCRQHTDILLITADNTLTYHWSLQTTHWHITDHCRQHTDISLITANNTLTYHWSLQTTHWHITDHCKQHTDILSSHTLIADTSALRSKTTWSLYNETTFINPRSYTNICHELPKQASLAVVINPPQSYCWFQVVYKLVSLSLVLNPRYNCDLYAQKLKLPSSIHHSKLRY